MLSRFAASSSSSAPSEGDKAIDEMSAAELNALISRLEAVATRLETTAGGAGAASGELQYSAIRTMVQSKWKIGCWSNSRSKCVLLSGCNNFSTAAKYSTLPTVEFTLLSTRVWELAKPRISFLVTEPRSPSLEWNGIEMGFIVFPLCAQHVQIAFCARMRLIEAASAAEKRLPPYCIWNGPKRKGEITGIGGRGRVGTERKGNERMSLNGAAHSSKGEADFSVGLLVKRAPLKNRPA